MKNKKIITATLLVSDGPVQNSYFEELLEIDGNKLFKLFDEINNDLTNLGFGSVSYTHLRAHETG